MRRAGWTAGVLSAGLTIGLSLASGPARAADPTTPECLAANDGSINLRRAHKLRAARAQSLICIAASCPAEIRRECSRRVEAINAAIPTVVFETVDATGNDLAAVKVTIDGEALVEHLEGTALSIDPGPHAFTFEAAGKAVAKKDLVILEGQKDRRVHVELAEAPAAGTPAAPLAQAPPSAPRTSPPGAATAPSTSATVPAAPAVSAAPPVSLQATPQAGPGFFDRLGARKTVALASAAVGVVGLGVGIGYGLKSMSKHSDAQGTCPNDDCATQGGVNLWHDAVSAGTVSTVGFVVGGLGIAGGALLWFLPRHESSGGGATTVSVAPGAIGVRGVW
jgi:hypothetical protein